MNVHFRKPSAQMPEEQSEQSFYGVCEIIVGYQKVRIEVLKFCFEVLIEVFFFN